MFKRYLEEKGKIPSAKPEEVSERVFISKCVKSGMSKDEAKTQAKLSKFLGSYVFINGEPITIKNKGG